MREKEGEHVKCLNCEVKGDLRVTDDGRVLLVPRFWKEELHYRQDSCRPARHGFGTKNQLKGVLLFGSTFWIVIVIIVNFVNYELSKEEPSYLTTVCQAGFKTCSRASNDFNLCTLKMHNCTSSQFYDQPSERQIERSILPRMEPFTDEENEMNQRRCAIKKFYVTDSAKLNSIKNNFLFNLLNPVKDAKTCQFLCHLHPPQSKSSDDEKKCKNICFSLTRSLGTAGQVCPFEKYCAKGCPCLHYQCDRADSIGSKVLPVWDTSKFTAAIVSSESLFYRRDSDWDLLPNQQRTKNQIGKSSIHQIALFNFETQNKTLLIGDNENFSRHNIGSIFLNGKHYFVSADGILAELKERKLNLLTGSKKVGNFMFHFFSTIGNYRIEIPNEGVFGVVVICSPSSRRDKCFYYAPERNLRRFEVAQGLIANNHFNAKTSSIVWNDEFFLISSRFGDLEIRTSSTLSLTPIRWQEESAKGWKKGSIGLSTKFKDFEIMDVIPLVHLNKPFLLIISRSLLLTNTKASLLLSHHGQLINLGSEWLGNIEKHRVEEICYSAMLAKNDPFYNRPNRHECGYFRNAFLINDRFYIQSLVFDVTFEIDFEFDLLELFYERKKRSEGIYLASNPNFAFHDDVFPGFAKSTVSQPKFPRHSCGDGIDCKVLVPHDSGSIAADSHFSTIDYRKDWKLVFDIKCGVKKRARKAFEVFRNDGSAFFTAEIMENDAFIFNFGDKGVLRKNDFICKRWWTSLQIEFKNDQIHISRVLDQINKKYSLIDSLQIGDSRLLPSEGSRLKLWSGDESVLFRKFYYYNRLEPFIFNLGHFFDRNCDDCRFSYFTSGSGFFRKEIKLKFPKEEMGKYFDPLYKAKSAMVREKVHFFGGVKAMGTASSGSNRPHVMHHQIARLDGCKVNRIDARLVGRYSDRSSVVAFPLGENSKALICFPTLQPSESTSTECELFDGSSVSWTNGTNFKHTSTCMGLYKNQPTVVGCWINSWAEIREGKKEPGCIRGKVETLTPNGWETLADHPDEPEMGACVSTDGGLITIGGQKNIAGKRTPILNVSMLKDDAWEVVGKLKRPSLRNTAIWTGKYIFVTSGEPLREQHDHLKEILRPIQRLEWNGSDLASSLMSLEEGLNWSPFIFQVPVDFCSL